MSTEAGALIVRVLPDLFMIRVPLPWSSPNTVNSYVIKAKRPLIIDTGFNAQICYTTFIDSLSRIGVDYREADYFITHFHADHSGLARRLADSIYMSEDDARILQEGIFKPELIKFFVMNGFPRNVLEEIVRLRSAVNAPREVSFQVVRDGEVLEYGNYALRAILTPGHTPGHMCLYDEERKILFTGDHILFEVTPNIQYCWEGCDPLSNYLGSLEKIYELDVRMALPGHGDPGGNLGERISEIRGHHMSRLNEIMNALRNGAKTARELAHHITWNIPYESWDALPFIQKWFIMNEVVAHLIHLERKGIVSREVKGEIIYYKLAKT